MICHHYKCVFVHVPKNAGQSIEQVFLNQLNLTWETRSPLLLRNNDKPELGPPRLAHLKAEEYVRYKYLTPEMFRDYFKFAFVRNPWSRVVSLYIYLGYNKTCDFKSFLFGTLKKTLFNEKNWFVGPQGSFVYTDNDELLVDFIGRFENLENDFGYVCKRVGLPQVEIPHANQSSDMGSFLGVKPKKLARNVFDRLSRNNPPKHKHYREYYDLECIEVVAELYRRDIDLFKYTF